MCLYALSKTQRILSEIRGLPILLIVEGIKIWEREVLCEKAGDARRKI